MRNSHYQTFTISRYIFCTTLDRNPFNSDLFKYGLTPVAVAFGIGARSARFAAPVVVSLCAPVALCDAIAYHQNLAAGKVV